MSSEAEPDHVITQTALPPDPDRSTSKQSAQDFLAARANGDATVYELGHSVERIFGDWRDGGTQAFIATSLDGSVATPESGRRIADAFADWQTSENGDGRVSVYDKEGKLLHTGTF
jgi:hypothetical protein